MAITEKTGFGAPVSIATRACGATVVLGLVLLLCGCASTFEGATQYRESPAEAKATAWEGPYREQDTTAAFKPHDPLSIYLKSAFFAWCAPHWFEKLSAEVTSRRAKCRIALVANVGQRLEQTVDRAGTGNPGRIVFYSPDVQYPQFVNQSQGLLYSTQSWDGSDLTIDLTTVELATADATYADNLLQALASLGTAPSFGLGGQEAINVLDKIGGAFVSASSQDSVIGYYRFTLSKELPDSVAYMPTLREGDVVLIRSRDETREAIDWDDYVYDPSDGALYERWKKADTPDYCNDKQLILTPRLAQHVQALDPHPLNDECYIRPHNRNYLVLSFVKKADVDWIPATTLASLTTAIQKDSPSMIQQAAAGVADTLIQGRTLHQARDSLSKIKDTKEAGSVKTAQAQILAGILQCAYINSLTTPADSVKKFASENCGGSGWASTALSPGEYANFSEQLSACGLNLSDADLIGNSSTTPNDARGKLASKLAGVSCGSTKTAQTPKGNTSNVAQTK